MNTDLELVVIFSFLIELLLEDVVVSLEELHVVVESVDLILGLVLELLRLEELIAVLIPEVFDLLLELGVF